MPTMVQQQSRQSFGNPSPTKYPSSVNVDKVVQSVTNATKRLSQISTNTNSSAKKRKTQNRIGPWKLGRTLGRGSTGRVRLAKNVNTGKLAAVKIVPKSNFKKLENPKYKRNSVSSSNSTKDRLPYGIEREIIIMKLISHPNIMGLYDVWENKNDLYLILEYIEGGELFDYLIKKGKLQEFEAVNYFKQIIHGIHYLHQYNICHRDLKPENLLLDFNKNIKIADFGMAALEVREKLLETSCGSPHYASPEIVAGKSYHGAPSDIWSCGIILFALLTGHLPFDDENIRKLLLKVQNGKFLMPNNLSSEAKDLITKMLQVDPNNRITINAILNHPLLTKYPEPSTKKADSFDSNSLNIKPIDSINKIDKEVLKNLSVLFHNREEQTIISKLLSPENCSEKMFYYLLMKYRNEHLTTNNNSINNYDDDIELTGSESKQTLPRSTSIIRTVTTDQTTGEKHTTIRKIPNSTSNFSNKSIRTPKRKNEVLGNITNTVPEFKASSSFNKKALRNKQVISRNNSSKSIKKRPPQQQPPKMSRKLTGLNDLNDLCVENMQLSSLYKQQKLKKTASNKSLLNFEKVCQEIFSGSDQQTEGNGFNDAANKSSRKTLNNTKKMTNIEKCERELAAKVHEKNEVRAEKIREQQIQEDKQALLRFQMEEKKKDQSRILQEKQRQALAQLESNTINDNENHRNKFRNITEPTPEPSLDPRFRSGAASLIRAKSLATPSTYATSRNAEKNENTSKVLRKLGIDVAPLKTSTKFNGNLKTSSSKNLADYLDEGLASSEYEDPKIKDNKENISLNKYNANEKFNKPVLKPHQSKSMIPKSQPSNRSINTMASMGYRSMLTGIDENKIQNELPKPIEEDGNNQKFYGLENTTTTSVDTRRSLIPNPRFSRFSFNGLLNSGFDNPDNTIQNDLKSSGTVIKKNVTSQKLNIKQEAGFSTTSSTTNLLGLGIDTKEQQKQQPQQQIQRGSRKISQNSAYHDSNFISVNLSDTGDETHDNDTLEENAISISDSNSDHMGLDDLDKSRLSSEVPTTNRALDSDMSNIEIINTSVANIGKLNKHKPNYVEHSDGSKDTLVVESGKDDKPYQDSIKSMYKDYAGFYNDKKSKPEIPDNTVVNNTRISVSSSSKSQEKRKSSDIRRVSSVDSERKLSFAADRTSNIDILDSSSDRTSNIDILDSSSIPENTNIEDNRSSFGISEGRLSTHIVDGNNDQAYDDEGEDMHNEEPAYDTDYETETRNRGEHDLRKSTASTQIFSTVLPKIRDKNSVVEENEEPKEVSKPEEHNTRSSSIFQKLKPKREAPKPPRLDEEKIQGHNRFSRISTSSKFDRQQKSNDKELNQPQKGNWFTKLIHSLTANTRTPKGEKRRSLVKKVNPEKFNDFENKNICILESCLNSNDLTRVIRNTLELKKMEGSVSKVDIDEEFGIINGVIPAKYASGRRLNFKMEIINLNNTSSMHLIKLKGSDRGFKNLANIVKFIINQEEQSINNRISYSQA